MQRERIMELVQIRGGIHKSQLCRELNLAWGTIGHHLRVLSGNGGVVLQYIGQELWIFHPLVPREQYPATILARLRSKFRSMMAM